MKIGYVSFIATWHTHTRLMALCPGLPRWAGTRKVKPIWILLKQETVSGSGISWAICKSAPCSRQITMPAPHHSVFLQVGCPSCHPTNSVKALKAQHDTHAVHMHSTYAKFELIVLWSFRWCFCAVFTNTKIFLLCFYISKVFFYICKVFKNSVLVVSLFAEVDWQHVWYFL